MNSAAIIGGSGYTGGELLRLLILHPEIEVEAITSESYVGEFVSSSHPNLRKQTDLKFVSKESLESYDVLFFCTPHGTSMNMVPEFLDKAKTIIDLSADYRLKNPQDYVTWYGSEHSHPELLKDAVYGIAEIHREEMKKAKIISGAGCLATSAILALYPLFKEKVVQTEQVVVDSKVGSSAAGNKPSLGSHHPERSGCVRNYQPVMHRHTAEMEQELEFGVKPTVSFTPHAIEMVRGILSTCHVFLKKTMDEKEIWGIYRSYYSQEPFIRIVKDRKGVYRFPEPKLLTGSNFCDIGFVRDTHSTRLVVISAIDNLMKGAAGAAVQNMNIKLGLDETLGLESLGYHPI
ncbi:N-acetyl-gamma-glutamyl-phosphate reductase [Candidatus Altiarchaeota archaeon]